VDKFKSGTVMGSGSVLRTLAWWWLASMYSWDFMLNYAQLFGIPFRKAEIAPATTEQKKGEIRQLLESMGSAGYIMLDAGNKVEFERAASGAGESPQAFLAHFANDQKRKVLLRQTMSGGTAGGGSKGVGKSFGDVEADGPKEQLFQAGAMYAESVINLQLIPYILNVNFGEGGDLDAPTVSLVDQKVGGLQDAQRDAILVKMVDIGVDSLRRKYGLEKPAPDEPIAGKDEGVQPPTLGGFGGEPGGEPGGEEPQEPETAPTDEDEPTEARHAIAARHKPRAALKAAQKQPSQGVASVKKAFLDTVSPLVKRMAAIEAITDVDVKRDALNKLAADLPKITQALKADPTLAESVAENIGAS